MEDSILKSLGIKIGHYTDLINLTGTTVFIAEKGANIGIDIRGSNTGTLNIPAFDPKAAGKLVHGIVLSGGSTFGLESAFGVMQYLEKNKIGNITRGGIVPGITGAVIYDIAVGNKVYPNKSNGYTASENASFNNLNQGNIGVGIGATVGKWFKGKKMKGGFGMSYAKLPNDIIVAAFVVTNSIGDIVNPANGQFYFQNGGFQNPFEDKIDKLTSLMDLSGTNTTLAVIATNVDLDKTSLMKIAELAHDGMARSIYPVHTNMDGDVIFALSALKGNNLKLRIPEITLVDVIGLAGSNVLAEAIINSVLNAESITGFPSYKF